MKRKISQKTLAIIILIVIVSLLFLIPFEIFLGKPSILGAVISKVFVKGLEVNYTCNISLTNGWNLISVGCEASNNSVISILNPIQDNYTSIHSYEPLEPIDYWKTYNPDMPAWVVQDLGFIDDESGYWINVDYNSTLQVIGSKTFPNSIPLVSGWNLIGYPDDRPDIPTNAFASIAGQYSIVWAYYTPTTTYQYYNPSLGNGTLTIIDPERGYWVNMSSGGTLWIT